MKVRVSLVSFLILACLTIGVFFVHVDAQTNSSEKTVTVTETVYTYTGTPIAETYTKTIREYVTVIRTSIEFSTIFNTQTITIVKVTSSTVTETITVTVHDYLPFETYSSMLGIMVASLIVLLVILIRLRRQERKQVEDRWS